MATPPMHYDATAHMTSAATSTDIHNMRLFMDAAVGQDGQTGQLVLLNLASFQQAVIARGWPGHLIPDLARFHRWAILGRQQGLTPTEVVLRMHDEMTQHQAASQITASASSNPATPNKRRRDEAPSGLGNGPWSNGVPPPIVNPHAPPFAPGGPGLPSQLPRYNQASTPALYGPPIVSNGNVLQEMTFGGSSHYASVPPAQNVGAGFRQSKYASQQYSPTGTNEPMTTSPVPTTPSRHQSHIRANFAHPPIAPSLSSSPQPGAFASMYAALEGSPQGWGNSNVASTSHPTVQSSHVAQPETPTRDRLAPNIQIVMPSPSRRGNLSGFRGVRGEQGSGRGRSGRGRGSFGTSQEMGGWPGMVPSSIPSSQTMPNLHGPAAASQAFGNTDDVPTTPSKRQRTDHSDNDHFSEVNYPTVEYDENGRVRTGLSQTPPAAEQRQTAHIDLTQDDDDDEPIGAPTDPPQIQQEGGYDLGSLQYDPLSEYGGADLFADLFDEPVSQDDGDHVFLPAASDVKQVGGIVQHAERLESEVVETPASAAAGSTPARTRTAADEVATPTTDITTQETGPSTTAGTPDVPVDLENWTAKLFVNSDQVGTFSSEGMKLFKKTMYADGPVLAANGTSFVQGKLTVSRPTVTQLRIAGAEAGVTNAETMEPYNIYVKKNTAPCKELKFVVTPGAYTVWRDDIQIGQGMHETARNAKNLTLKPDGSYAVVPPHQMLTFEEWHNKSDLQLVPDNIVDLDRFPKLPPQVNRCADCRLYKSPHNQTSTLGFEIGACEHDIKEFLWWSEMSKQMPNGHLGPHGGNFKGLVAHEQRRMGAVKWNLVQDDAVRTRLQEVAAEYVRLLGESLLLLR